MNRKPSPRRTSKFLIAGLALVFLGFSALSFIRFGMNAAFYSAWYATPRVAAELADVNRRGEFFFTISVALLLLAAGCVAPFISVGAESIWVRLTARYVAALVLAVFTTGILVWLLSSLGVGAMPAAFSK